MKKVFICQGMAYGDESKGSTVDFLCRKMNATLVVRYNGGHQAAHNVVLADGRHHTFAQFGSGTFIPAVRTHLSRFMLINPVAMLREEEHLQAVGVRDAFNRLTVDENCVVVTPFHRAFNRLEEMSRGHRAHGSCGLGIGCARRLELSGLALHARNLDLGSRTAEILRAICERLRSEVRAFAYRLPAEAEVDPEIAMLLDSFDYDSLLDYYRHWREQVRLVSHLEIPLEPMVFEGAQGVLLDETHGEAPHNTWTNTTFENAFTLLNEAKYDGEVVKMGCWRSYFTRHGNGPFPTEGKLNDSWWNLERFPELHNTHGRYQGYWRIGNFNFADAKHAVDICGGIDEISISHLDYQQLDLAALEYATGSRVTLKANGPTAEHRVYKGVDRSASHVTSHGLKEATSSR